MLATVTFTKAHWLFSSPSPKEEEVRSAAGVSFPLCPAPYPAPCVAARGCPSWWSGSRHGVPSRRVRAGSTAPGATCKHAACSSQRARRSSPAGENRNASWGLSHVARSWAKLGSGSRCQPKRWNLFPILLYGETIETGQASILLCSN